MTKCVICEQLKHEEEIYFTTVGKLSGTQNDEKAIVCEECMAVVEAVEELENEEQA